MTPSEQGSQVPEPCSETSPIIVPNPRRPHYYQTAGPHSKQRLPSKSVQSDCRSHKRRLAWANIHDIVAEQPKDRDIPICSALPLRTTLCRACVCHERHGRSVAQRQLWPLSKFHALRSSPKVPNSQREAVRTTGRASAPKHG
jgi:hypothetical protein